MVQHEMESTPHQTTLSAPISSSSWPTQLLPNLQVHHGITCQDQTIASAQHLLSLGQLTAEDFIETSPDIERTLMESFLEDDFDGKLHLTTLSMPVAKCDHHGGRARSGSVDEGEEIVGISFWREIPSDEMEDWMDMQRISKAIAEKKLMPEPASSIGGGQQKHSHEHDKYHSPRDNNDLSHTAQRRMKLVRNDSISWIQNALQPCQGQDDTKTDATASDKNATIQQQQQQQQQNFLHHHDSTATIQNKLTHSWIKIELIAIKTTHRAHHLGNILLACTLAKAHAFHANEHAILHIAGGGASKNIPAAKLYSRFGFVGVPQYQEGGPFKKPDRDLFVLGNIGGVLRSLPWEEMMSITDGGGHHDGTVVVMSEGGDSRKKEGKNEELIEDCKR